jgi:hypothetical protein
MLTLEWHSFPKGPQGWTQHYCTVHTCTYMRVERGGGGWGGIPIITLYYKLLDDQTWYTFFYLQCLFLSAIFLKTYISAASWRPFCVIYNEQLSYSVYHFKIRRNTKKMIHIQNAPSRNDPSQNDPSQHVPARNDPITKRPRSRNDPTLNVSSQNVPRHDSTQITKRPSQCNWGWRIFL